MLDTLATVLGIIFGLAGLIYAHHAHRTSIRSPILKLEFCHPDSRHALPLPKDPRESLRLHVSSTAYASKKRGLNRQQVGFSLPFIIRNIGTRTARDIRARAWYSVGLGVISTKGKRIEDGDRPNWLVLEYNLPDLHPRESCTYDSDVLIPDEKILRAFMTKFPVKTRDNKTVIVSATARISAVVEVAVYAADQEPIVRRATVDFDKKEDAGPAEADTAQR